MTRQPKNRFYYRALGPQPTLHFLDGVIGKLLLVRKWFCQHFFFFFCLGWALRQKILRASKG
jgi:hypothetical protein